MIGPYADPYYYYALVSALDEILGEPLRPKWSYQTLDIVKKTALKELRSQHRIQGVNGAGLWSAMILAGLSRRRRRTQI